MKIFEFQKGGAYIIHEPSISQDQQNDSYQAEFLNGYLLLTERDKHWKQ